MSSLQGTCPLELRPNHAKLVEGESVVVAEDITTTGDSAAKSCLTLLHVGARVVAVTAIWNRGGVNDIEGSERFLPLVSEELPKYAADDCPLCMEGTPISTDLGHGQTYLDENGLINCLKCGRLHKADASCGV